MPLTTLTSSSACTGLESGLPQQLLNTFGMALLIGIGQVVVAALASFALAHLRPRSSRLVFIALALSMVIPAQVLIVPQFLLTNTLDWKNTLAGLVVPQIASCALQVLIVFQHMSGLWPLLIADKPDSTTVQIGLQMYITAEGTNFGGLLAAAVIATLPILILYLFASRQITEAFLKAGSA